MSDSSQTFSQLVDRAVARSGRPDRQTDIEDFVYQTIQELHSDDQGNVYYFAKNLVEETLTATSESQYVWQMPARLQRIRTVRYKNVITRDYPDGLFPKMILPGRAQNAQDYFYYQTGDSIAFKGYGGLNAEIDIAYYQYPKRLKYYAEADRPAEYDIESGWSYHADYVGNEEAARDLVTTWPIFDYPELVLQGTLAKLFTLLADDRSVTAFSLFQRQRGILLTSELHFKEGV